MTSLNRSKINKLLLQWPPNTVAISTWLEAQGTYQQLVLEYKKSGWIEQIGHGAYIRCGDKVTWLGGLYAMEKQIGLKLHIAGKTALEMQNIIHFVPKVHVSPVYIFGEPNQKLPSWFLKKDWKRKITYRMSNLFDDKKIGISSYSLESFSISISSPERAILELISLIPKHQTVQEAFLILEGMVNLRPKLLQELLVKCRSVKVKRLFLALADLHSPAWFKKIDTSKIDLGSGNRAIEPGGTLNSKYHITLPSLKSSS